MNASTGEQVLREGLQALLARATGMPSSTPLQDLLRIPGKDASVAPHLKDTRGNKGN